MLEPSSVEIHAFIFFVEILDNTEPKIGSTLYSRSSTMQLTKLRWLECFEISHLIAPRWQR